MSLHVRFCSICVIRVQKIVIMKPNKFSITKRLQSFKHVLNGLKILIYEEHNARIHVVASVFVVFLSLALKINSFEWIAIILCIGMVIIAEIFNSVIENICDFISAEKHNQIKRIKDMAAAAVFFASVLALIVGGIVFIPKL